MSEHAVAVAGEPGTVFSFWDRHHFLIRRLHSLTGIMPIGVFLIEHLYTCSAILLGPKEYQTDINFIWNLPGLLFMEVGGIWLPIAFHSILGLVYTFGGARWNPVRYSYQGNWRYTLQRVTGIVAFIYIFFHIATTRWHWSFGGWYTPFDAAHATSTTANALQAYWWLPWFYGIGMGAAVYHFANGLWTSGITWGLTVSVAAQKRWGYICAALGILLALAGAGAIIKFSTMSPDAQAVMAAENRGGVQSAVVEENVQAPTTPGNPGNPGNPAMSVNPATVETH